ncbi:MAG: hypothetical protein IPK87_14600 [Planctomycetes bacterium]|nr:hypothetical protein [Planctomycetota bacterium]
MDPLHTLALSVAGMWVGAIGIGLIKVGLKLNTAVARLTVLVEGLNAQVNRHRGELRAMRATHLEHAERISALESRRR